MVGSEREREERETEERERNEREKSNEEERRRAKKKTKEKEQKSQWDYADLLLKRKTMCYHYRYQQLPALAALAAAYYY